MDSHSVPLMALETDFLVIGSGIAGLSYALEVSNHGRVLIITKKGRADSNTNNAQGGIAAVMAEHDSFESHKQDSMAAGAGLCHEEVVDMVVSNGPRQIERLLEWGVHFSEQQGGDYDLAREGGHSARRILHSKDTTGRAIEQALLEAIRQHPNIELLENQFAIDLITNRKLNPSDASPLRCLGAYVLDRKKGEVYAIQSRTTLLASGGAGKVYLYTSNPDIATGDGMAMAYRAGARLANLEFVQFHPTCLFHPEAKSFLISEAVRGEGALLRLPTGERFMSRYDDKAELAPRDIVARAIDNEMKSGGYDYVLLDITDQKASWVKERFPNIYRRCLEYGIDMTQRPLPVVPAAHYFCGGVLTDLMGQSDIAGLYATGETACTGLHGANRLASNSLLEALVFSNRAAQAGIQEISAGTQHTVPLPEWDSGQATDSDEEVVISQNWDEIRRFMWNYVGIVRSDKRLARALNRIQLMREEIKEYYWNFRITADLLELRNIADIAELTVHCALSRKESRGLHYNINYPEPSEEFCKDTIIKASPEGT